MAAKVLVVTSGKGGVGKTTSTAALGAALAQTGKKVVVVDFEIFADDIQHDKFPVIFGTELGLDDTVEDFMSATGDVIVF